MDCTTATPRFNCVVSSLLYRKETCETWPVNAPTSVQEKASVVNRLHKVLEWANLKLASVVTDLTGVSARKMLAAIVNGEVDEATLVDLAKVARSKR